MISPAVVSFCAWRVFIARRVYSDNSHDTTLWVRAMLTLNNSLAAWGSAAFEQVFKQELAQHAVLLPLQQALTQSSSVSSEPVTVLVQSATELEHAIRVKAGVFYQGLAGGCSCANDPTPESEYTEYCELLLDIDKASAEAAVMLLSA